MDIPRNFKLMDELDNSSDFPGVSYGLQNPEDIDFIYWYGTFITSTGHVINFNFICDDTYPFTSPLFYFDESYLNLLSEDCDDEEYGVLIDRIKDLFDEESTKLKEDCLPITNWTPEKNIGIFLSEIRSLIGEP